MSGAIAEAADGVSFVLTSCGRFDLLEQTLASFFDNNTYPVSQFIIVEDSGSQEVRDVVAAFPAAFEIIVNEQNLGQIASVDLAYAKVRRPLIFHCEDDWRFLRPGFIEDSLVIIKAFPQVSMVNMICPGILEDVDEAVKTCVAGEYLGVKFRIIPVNAHPLWFGYSFNPGLRRTADWRAIGSFAAAGHEPDISLHFKSLGMSIAVLEAPAYTHIGEGRQVPDKVFPIAKSEAFARYWKARKKNMRGG